MVAQLRCRHSTTKKLSGAGSSARKTVARRLKSRSVAQLDASRRVSRGARVRQISRPPVAQDPELVNR